MKIIIDEREHSLFEKCQHTIQSQNLSFHLSKAVLNLGDIHFKTNDDIDILLIERKTFSDLLSSIKDGRYEEQSYRLINSSGFSPHNIFYLLEGMFSQLYNPNDKKVILSCMTSLQFFKGFSIIRTNNLFETTDMILSMADKIQRELLKGKTPYYKQIQNLENNQEAPAANYCTVVKKVKKDNITPENIGEILLCQIPGISSITAIAIMKHFQGFPNLIEQLKQNPQCLDTIMIETNGKTRKINKSSIENIQRFLLIG